MYKALIVDDNPRERRGMQELLDWGGLGIEIVGTCANGLQVLETVGKDLPQIIITDVAMPLMNGIEMTQKLRESYPDIKVIFMSGYNDFDFVKSAIDLDIYSYILKPVKVEELVRAIEKVLGVIREESSRKQEVETMMKQLKESLPLVQEQFFRELLLYSTRDAADAAKRLEFLQLSHLRQRIIQVMDIQMKEKLPDPDKASMMDRYFASFTLKNIIRKAAEPSYYPFTVQISQEEYAVILFQKDAKADGGHPDIIDTAVRIHEEAKAKLNAPMVTGISEPSDLAEDIAALYRQSREAVNTMFYGEDNPIILYGDIKELHQLSLDGQVHLEELYREVKTIVSIGSEKDVEAFVERRLGKQNPCKSQEYVKSLIFSTVNAARIALIEVGIPLRDIFDMDFSVWRKLDEFEGMTELKNWVFQFMVSLQNSLNSRVHSRNSQIVSDIKSIIRQRYKEKITLSEIADSIYLSPKQANSIFKKETGKTIFDYLAEYRIEVAKQRLQDPYSKIYLVAEEVGYTNKSHFCLLFKKFIGLSPTEYKNKAVLK